MKLVFLSLVIALITGCYSSQNYSANNSVQSQSQTTKSGNVMCRAVYAGVDYNSYCFFIEVKNSSGSLVKIDPSQWYYTYSSAGASQSQRVNALSIRDLEMKMKNEIRQVQSEKNPYSDYYVEYGHNPSLLVATIETANLIKNGPDKSVQTTGQKQDARIDELERKQKQMEWELAQQKLVGSETERQTTVKNKLLQKQEISPSKSVWGQVYFPKRSGVDSATLNIWIGSELVRVPVYNL